MNRAHKADRVAALAMAALAIGLLIFAIPKLGAFPAWPASSDNVSAFLKEASPWLIAFWSTASLLLAYGWWKGERWSFAIGLALNLIYLIVSIVGVAFFGIVMHTIFGAYGGYRSFVRDHRA